MTRRLIALAVIAVLLSSPLLAASIEELSAENQEYYLRNALNIETKQNTDSNRALLATPFVAPFAVYIAGIGAEESITTTEWTPYKGAEEISKIEFMTLTGQLDLAEKLALEYERTRRYNIAGYALIGTGIAGVTGCLIYALAYNNDAFLSKAFVGTFLSSAIAAVAGIPLISMKASDNFSLTFVAGMADMYNRRLLESLK